MPESNILEKLLHMKRYFAVEKERKKLAPYFSDIFCLVCKWKRCDNGAM